MFYKGVEIGQALKRERYPQETVYGTLLCEENGTYTTPTYEQVRVDVPEGGHPPADQIRRVLCGAKYSPRCIGDNFSYVMTLKDVTGTRWAISTYLFHVEIRGVGQGVIGHIAKKELFNFTERYFQHVPKNEALGDGLDLGNKFIRFCEKNKFDPKLNGKSVDGEKTNLILTQEESLKLCDSKGLPVLGGDDEGKFIDIKAFRVETLGDFPSGSWVYTFDIEIPSTFQNDLSILDMKLMKKKYKTRKLWRINED